MGYTNMSNRNRNRDRQQVAQTPRGPAEGPNAKGGTDSVPAPASSVTFNALGRQFAKSLEAIETGVISARNTLRENVTTVLQAEPETWETFTDGMTEIMDERKKAGQPIAYLMRLRSEVSRVLNAAKTNPGSVRKIMADKKDWHSCVRAMPKKSNGQGAGGGKPPESKSEITVNSDGIGKETNAGTLLQIVTATLHRMVELGKGHEGYFAWYVGQNTLDMLELSASEFQKIHAEHNVGGVIQDKTQFLVALGLAEKTKPEQPAPVTEQPAPEPQAAEPVQEQAAA